MAEEKKQQAVKNNVKPADDTKEEKKVENTQNKSTQTQVNSGKKYSGFWVRGAAYIIDGFVAGILAMIIAVPVAIIIGVVTVMIGSDFLIMVGQFFTSILGLLVVWGYFIFMTHKYQATLGKMAVGVKVHTDDGVGKMTLGKVVLRETVGKFVSNLFFGIGYIIAAFTQKKQALHDFIASSTVTYKDPAKGPNMVAVILAYVAWGCLMFIGFIIILFFGAVLTAMLLGMFGVSNATDNYMDDFKNSIIQDSDINYNENTTNIKDMPMNMDTEGMQELEQMLQDLDIDVSNTY
jgi:uncharacterized RDD family membrane protein YckC